LTERWPCATLATATLSDGAGAQHPTQPWSSFGHGGSLIEAHFTAIDWAVLVGYLVFTTVLGAKLAGKQATIRDFFLGGRKLPWPAVTGSIIATEISAVTFLGAPAIVFAAGGDLTYLQLALGAILARVIIGVWFVPAFYEREIYSPYDYMGNRLGRPARSVTTGLFMLGAVLGQSVRVLLTALVLELMTGLPLSVAIWIIGAMAVAWTLLGGITTVIWTDVVQFVVFAIGIVAALVYVCIELPGGWDGMVSVAAEAGKFRLWNFSTDPNVAFTIWAALIANTVMCLNAYGTDQLVAQRIFCCKGPRQARIAIIASSVGQLVTLAALFVGIGLFAYYQHYPLTGEAADLVAERGDRVFPVFILQQMPVGLIGLIIAGVFAAAISSLDSVLAALSQTVISGFYRPWREGGAGVPPANEGSVGVPPANHDGAGSVEGDGRHYVFVSKLLVVAWGIVLCAMAQVSKLAWDRYDDILNLALAMATYTGGPLLAAFCLAFFRLNVDHRGIVWSAPLSVLTVFAITWHQGWAQVTTIVVATAILLAWIAVLATRNDLGSAAWWRDAVKTVLVALAGALAVFLCCFHYGTGEVHYLTVAWPWNAPLGFTVAFTLGYLLARPQRA